MLPTLNGYSNFSRLAQESDRLESSQKSRKKRVSLWDELTQEVFHVYKLLIY